MISSLFFIKFRDSKILFFCSKLKVWIIPEILSTSTAPYDKTTLFSLLRKLENKSQVGRFWCILMHFERKWRKWEKLTKVRFEPETRRFVAKQRATRRWKALTLYFKIVRTFKYVHTSGTSCAHIRHTSEAGWSWMKLKFYACAWCVPRVCRYLGCL